MSGGLRRDLSRIDAVAVIVGTMIGSGIFLGPEIIAQAVPGSATIILVWLVAGVLIFFGALTHAELGAAQPESGGGYVFLREAYGPFWGFLVGWSQLTVTKTGSIAALAVAFATFLRELVGLSDVLFLTLPVGLIVVLSVLNYVGVKYGGMFQTLTTSLKVIAIIALIVFGLAVAAGGRSFDPVFPTVTGLPLVIAFGASLIPALWAYDGWVNVTQVAEEVRDPQKNVPFALVAGTALVVGLYVLTNLAYIGTVGIAGFSATDATQSAGRSIAAAAGLAAFGPQGAQLIILAVLVSVLGTTNAVILSGPRIYYAMSRDGLFFKNVGATHEKFGTPGAAIILQMVLASILALSGTFTQLITYVIFTSWVFYAMTGYAVIVMRRKRPDMVRPFRVPGYPWVPLAFVLLSVFFVIASVIAQPRESAIGAVIVLTGVPAYLYWRRKADKGERVVEVVLKETDPGSPNA
ncbi:MAG: amino acid permease [Euryarchaeota archaeon]|nr:amino acid permease [Euryarchaeota archaeon]